MGASDPGANKEWTLHPLHVPLAVAYRWARGVQHSRDVILVRYEGETTGWGEIAPPPDDTRPLDEWHAEAAASLADPDSAHPRIRCGLVGAVADAEARAAGRSLAEHWHASPQHSVPVNILITAQEPDAVRQMAAAAQAAGHQAMKLKVGMDLALDVNRARVAREGAPDIRLRIDANAAWSPAEAQEALERFAPYDIDYVEQPVAPEHVDALRALGEGPIPIALDESATDAETIEALLSDGVGQVVIVKPQRVGGPDHALECLDAARRHRARAVITNSLETSIGVHHALHLAAGTSEPAGLATSHYLQRNVCPPPPIRNGTMTVPGPGLGTAPEDF